MFKFKVSVSGLKRYKLNKSKLIQNPIKTKELSLNGIENLTIKVSIIFQLLIKGYMDEELCCAMSDRGMSQFL